MDMELNMVHLYPDVMSLYGEYANIAVLRRHLEALGVTVAVKAVTCEDAPDFTGADFIYMGAGAERGQKCVLEKLRPHGDGLKAAIEAGAVVLFTGSAMELLGQSVTDSKGKVWPALGLAGFASVETDQRDPGDAVARTSLLDWPVVGFMNKCSVTSGVTAPLFDALTLGFGNEADKGAEGYVSGNVFATHLTGPVLVKNPHFTEFLVRRFFEAREWELPETLPVLPYEREAYEVTLAELSARVK